MKKKLVVTGLTLVVLMGAAGWYAQYRAKQAIANEVVTMLNSPTTKSEIAQLEKTVKVPSQSQISKLEKTVKIPTLPANALPGVSAGSQIGAQSGTASGGSVVSSGSQSVSSGTAASPSGGTSASTSPGTQGAATSPTFTSRQQIINYAMGHFTQGEIVHYMQAYVNRAQLSPQQKEQIKLQILSHFTAGEIQAMQTAAAKYP